MYNYEKCPICGNKLNVVNYKEDYYIVETDEKCVKCGYHKNNAYGRTEITFQNCYETYYYNTNRKIYNKIYKSFNKARWKYRKYLLRTNKIKGKSYSKYF